MISSIELTNFKCFNEYKIKLRKINVIVGKNNAGKSTIIEALRLVSIASNRYLKGRYGETPSWLEILDEQLPGFSLSVKNMGFNLTTIFHRYGDPPSIVKCDFLSGTSIEIYIGLEEKIHAVVRNEIGYAVRTITEAKKIKINNISVLPLIAPLLVTENVLSKTYVNSTMFSNLAPLHFRNELYYYKIDFDNFKKLAEKTWEKLMILDLEPKSLHARGERLVLFVQDNDFVAEIGWMGHGLQMWLQIIWFLIKSNNEQILILDEPDVYLHADLQRKLFNILKSFNKQILITTHSIEIISECDVSEVLIIDKLDEQSNFADKIPILQEVINDLGTVYNISLTKFISSMKCVFVEGSDFEILKILSKRVELIGISLSDIPVIPTNGWGGWDLVIGSAKFVNNAIGPEFNIYCILDSDYYVEKQLRKRYQIATESNIQLHIWKQKELENYLIKPEVIFRQIKDAGISNITLARLQEKISSFCEDLKDNTLDLISSQFRAANRGWDNPKSNVEARKILNNNWNNLYGKISIVSGKKLLNKINGWTKSEFNLRITKYSLAKGFQRKEIPDEIIQILEKIVLK